MSRLWDKGVDLDQRVLAYTAGDDYALDERLVNTTCAPRSRTPRCSTPQKLLADRGPGGHPRRPTAIGAEHAAGKWKIELADEDGQTALEKRLTARIGAAGGRVHLGRSRNDQVLTALRLYLLDAAHELAGGRGRLRRRARCARGARRQTSRCPATPTCSRPCRAAWRCGPAASPRNCATTRRPAPPCARRASRSPLGSAAGYGTPGLPLDRELTRAKLGFDDRARAGHGGAALARQGRGAAAVRVHAAHAGPRPPRRRPAAVLYAGIRVRHAAGRRSPPARRSCRRSAIPMCSSWCAAAAPWRTPACRSARHLRQAAVGLSARPAAHQAAAVPRHRPRARHRRHHGAWQSMACVSAPTGSNSTPRFTPPKKRMRWSRARAFRSARRIAASARNTASSARPSAGGDSGVQLEVTMAIWFGNPTIETRAQPGRPARAASRHRIHRVRRRLPARHDAGGAAHAPAHGLSCTAAPRVVLAETLGSVAANFVVDRDQLPRPGDQRQSPAAGADGLVTGTARPFHLGSRSQVWSIEIRDPRERLVCISRLTIAVVEWRSRSGGQREMNAQHAMHARCRHRCAACGQKGPLYLPDPPARS